MEPQGDTLDELIGQPFSVCPGTVYAQVGWYAPDARDLYLLTEDLSPADRLKPVYIYCGNADVCQNPYHITESPG